IWISLLTLTVLEIVLGIDNIVFISILSGKLPEAQQKKARRLGLLLALIMRVALLFSVKWVMSLTGTLINLADWFNLEGETAQTFLRLSGRDLMLLEGGLFLMYKSTTEIQHKIEGSEEGHEMLGKKISFSNVIFQIIVLDLVFSLDSVIPAGGMVDQSYVMIAA